MAVSKRLRFETFRRDIFTCHYCGASAPDVVLTIDHILPKTLGGTDAPDNLVTACADCNSGKTSTKPDEQIAASVSAEAQRWEAEKNGAVTQPDSGDGAMEWLCSEVDKGEQYGWTLACEMFEYNDVPHRTLTQFIDGSAPLHLLDGRTDSKIRWVA